MQKKLLASVLVIAMLFTFVPSGVFAADTVHGTSDATINTHRAMGDWMQWDDSPAVYEITTGSNIVLTDNQCTMTSDLVISGQGTVVTMCLNGNTLDMGDYSIHVTSGSSLIIEDCNDDYGVITSSQEYGSTIHNKGTVNLYGGKIENTAVTNGEAIRNEGNNAIFNMTGGEVTAVAYGIYNAASANCTISDGAVHGENYGIYNFGAVCTISDGAITGDTYGVYNYDDANCIVNGGMISGKTVAIYNNKSNCDITAAEISGVDYGIYNGRESTCIIGSNATITGVDYGIYNDASACTINGGSVTGSSEAGIMNKANSTCTIVGGIITGNTYGVQNDVNVDCTVNGGSVSGEASAVYNNSLTCSITAGELKGIYGIHNTTGSAITISGGNITGSTYGVFNANEVNCTVNDGEISGDVAAIYNSNSICGIADGQIESMNYGVHNTTGSALTISGGDISGSMYGVFNETDATCTVDGGTISGKPAAIYNSRTTCEINDGNVVGEDYGVYNDRNDCTVNGGSISGNASAIYNDGATCDIHGGNIVGNVYGIFNNTANCTINGGTITGTTQEAIMNDMSSTCKINGGTMKGTNRYGIYNNTDSTIYLSGAPVIQGDDESFADVYDRHRLYATENENGGNSYQGEPVTVKKETSEGTSLHVGDVVVYNTTSSALFVSNMEGFMLEAGTGEYANHLVLALIPPEEEPGTDTPGDDNPGDDTPGTDTPGGDNPSDDTPGTDTPGDDDPGDDTPGTDNPGSDTPGTDTPGDNNPGGNTGGSGGSGGSSGGSSGGGGGGGMIVATGYAISIGNTNGATVTVSDSTATVGKTVVAIVTSNSGFGIVDVVVKDIYGNKITVTDLGGGKYSFIMPASKTNIEVVCKPAITLTIGSQYANVFGMTVMNDVAPMIRDSRTMLPIRFVAEALGGAVDWDEAAQKVTITKTEMKNNVKTETKIEIFIDKNFAYVNGNFVELDSPAFIENSRTYLPVRFVSEQLGATVQWDEQTQRVTIMN